MCPVLTKVWGVVVLLCIIHIENACTVHKYSGDTFVKYGQFDLSSQLQGLLEG